MKKITCSHDTDVPVEEWPVRPYSKSELARVHPRLKSGSVRLLTAFRAGCTGTCFCIRLCWIRATVLLNRFLPANRWN